MACVWARLARATAYCPHPLSSVSRRSISLGLSVGAHSVALVVRSDSLWPIRRPRPGSQGNFLGPLVGLEGRNAYLVRDLWRCSGLIRAREEARARTYRYWAFCRLDFYWLAFPPPLQMLRESDPHAAWIPDGQDWDGTNDRFALIPRVWAHTYFDRWPRTVP